jgi:hypothetical protein
MYSLLGLLAATSMSCFIRLLESDAAQRSRFIGYVTASALMLYTHVYAIFVIAAQHVLMAAALARAEPGTRARMAARWAVAQAATVVLFLPWLPVLFDQAARVNAGFWIPEPDAATLVWTFVKYGGSWPLAAVLCGLAALGVRRLWTEASGRPTLELLLVWFAAPILLPLAASYAVEPIYLPKYAIAASIPLVMLAAKGAAGFGRANARAAALAGVAVLSVAPLDRFYNAIQKDAWRTAVAELERDARPGDLVLLNQGFGRLPFEYYRRRTDLMARPFPAQDARLLAGRLEDLLGCLVQGRRRVWLVLSHQDATSGSIVRRLEDLYDMAAYRRERGVELYLFETGRAH